MDREAQINAIEKTFEDAKKPIERHYSKPGVHAVEVLPVFPDFKVRIVQSIFPFSIISFSSLKQLSQSHVFSLTKFVLL